MTTPGCGRHRAFVVDTLTQAVVAELVDIVSVYWDRRRDDISEARVFMGLGCCGAMGGIKAVRHQLHLYRDDVLVWQGIIVRIEYDHDRVEVYAEDMLWVAKRRVLEYGWVHDTQPPIPAGQAPKEVEWARELLVNRCFAMHGDHWQMAGRVFAYPHPDDSQVRSNVNAFQVTIWQALDDLSRYNSLDYTCVAGNVYLQDVHLRQFVLPPLLPEHLSRWPRIVEYGNDYANRAFVTDGSGYAGSAVAPAGSVAEYGAYVDLLSNSTPATEETPSEVPSAATLAMWQLFAQSTVERSQPPPVAIVVPTDSTLMPSSPWDVNTVIPGSWFEVHLDHSCRTVSDWHKLQTIKVTDEGQSGELVQVTTVSAPPKPVDP